MRVQKHNVMILIASLQRLRKKRGLSKCRERRHLPTEIYDWLEQAAERIYILPLNAAALLTRLFFVGTMNRNTTENEVERMDVNMTAEEFCRYVWQKISCREKI